MKKKIISLMFSILVFKLFATCPPGSQTLPNGQRNPGINCYSCCQNVYNTQMDRAFHRYDDAVRNDCTGFLEDPFWYRDLYESYKDRDAWGARDAMDQAFETAECLREADNNYGGDIIEADGAYASCIGYC